MAGEIPRPDADTELAMNAGKPVDLEALEAAGQQPKSLREGPRPWSKKKLRAAVEEYVDPDPGNYKDPQNEPIGIERNNELAEEHEKIIDEFTSSFYPKPPTPKTRKGLALLSLKHKKLRFLQSYNARAGNMTFACIESGLTRAEAQALIKADAEFCAAVEEIKLQIVDRMKYVLHQRIGTVKSPVALGKLADNLLAKSLQAFDKEYFGDQGAGTVVVRIEIPRPQYGAGDPAQLPADGAPVASPQLPS